MADVEKGSQEGAKGFTYFTSLSEAIKASESSGSAVLVIDSVLGDGSLHTVYVQGKTVEGFNDVLIGGPMTFNPTSFVVAPGARPQPSSGE